MPASRTFDQPPIAVNIEKRLDITGVGGFDDADPTLTVRVIVETFR
jgi:hypothetical protein